MTQTYLVFVRNQTNFRDFAVPLEADSVGGAVALASARYPGPVYHCLTCFASAELQGFIDDAARWPGVPSTVQPPLEDLLRKVTVGTTLPPLPSVARRVDLDADEVRVLPEAEAEIRRAALQRAAAAEARVQQALGTVPGVMEREAKIAMAEGTPAFSDRPRRAAQPPAQAAKPATPSFNQGRSVVDVLKALRG